MKIKKGDTVKVIAGKDKGKEGKVLAVNVKDNTHVDNDLIEFWHFHNVFISEFLGHGIHNLIFVKLP